MSDTPETDVSCGYALSSHYGRLDGSYLQMDWSGPFVHAEVARKLERERDEALMDRANGDIATMTRNHYERILRERDEVREAFKIVYNERVQMELERNEWKNKAYSHATDYTLMEAKCFRLEQQLKEYDQLKS